MTGKTWRRRTLLVLAYSIPVLALAVYVSFSFAAASIPFWPGDETVEHDEHLLIAESFPLSSSARGQIGGQIPSFTLQLVNEQTVTSDELLTEGKPTFLFFWGAT